LFSRVIVFIFFLAITLYSSSPDEIKLYRLDNATRENVKTIEKTGGSLSRFFPNSFAEVYLNQNQFDELKKRGYTLYSIINKDKLYADSLYDATKFSPNPMLSYHTYQEITDTLSIWAQQFSNIAELHSIGLTVQGREMWIMKISDNVSTEEAEPEFKYISTMHGDEVVGKEMMIELIRLLLHEYGTTQRITDLVNNTEIWIMPDMNFDGTQLHQRNNANGVNLNRNFPDREYGDPPYTGHNYVIQPETQNVIDFTAQHNFVLSANFHGGALVANYPWDKKLPDDPGAGYYSAAPDDITFIDLALTYAERNLPMYNSSVFPNGITNGAEWYEIDGGMQDWNYYFYDCMGMTIELGDKWPAVSRLPQFWLENKESLLAYMEKVHTGIKGIVTDSQTGLPVEAYITVLETGTGVGTDSYLGDYYKVIFPGVYNLFVSAEGYRDSLITNVVVDSFPATIIDVQLIPEIKYNLEILVIDDQTSNPLQNTVISLFKKDTLFVIDSTNFNGLFQVDVEPDSFYVKIEKENYFNVDTLLKIYSDTTFMFEMQQIHPAIIKGNVYSSGGGNVDGAVVYCDGVVDTLHSDGIFHLNGITPGSITLFAALYNHKTSRIDTVVNNGDSLDVLITIEEGSNEIFDDLETSSIVTFTESGDWEIGTPSSGPINAYSGVSLWATNLSGKYSNGNLLSTLETGEIVIFGINNPVLKFYHWYDIETGIDGGNVKISVDNGISWQIITPAEGYPVTSLPGASGNPLGGEPAFSGQQQFWDEVTFDLTSYAVYPVIKIRYDFGVDQTGNAAGWYIDNLQIIDGIVVKTKEQEFTNSELLPSIRNYPNPFNPETNIHITIPQKSFVNLKIFDIKGALVKDIVSKIYQAGDYTFKWDGTNQSQLKVATGVYFLRLSLNINILNRKLILIR
jgi:hypothetical protein